MFEAFRERDYRAFWLTQFLSNIGSWMQAVAQGWLVYRMTDSEFLLGFVGFASSAPAIFLMLPGGVLADQLDRKRVVAISQWAQAGAAMWLAIAIWFDVISVWQIIAAALVVGTAQSFSAPAWQAMLIDLLDDRGNLPNAVAMNSLQFNFSRAIGPVLAGVALSMWGSFWCFFVNAVSFLPLIFVLGRVTRRQVMSSEPPAPIFSRLREGFRFVRKDRVVMTVLGVVASASLFGYPYIQLMPVAARQLFTDDRAGVGWLMGGVGFGAFIGALWLSVRTPKRILATIIVSLLVFGVTMSALAVVKNPYAVVAMLAVCGASMVAGSALCNTTIQQRIPDAMRGRVLSMYTFAFFAFFPAGSLLAGAIAEHRGLDAALVVLGAGVFATGVTTWALLRPFSPSRSGSPQSPSAGT